MRPLSENNEKPNWDKWPNLLLGLVYLTLSLCLCPKWDELPLLSIPPEFLVELAIAGTYQTINLAFLF